MNYALDRLGGASRFKGVAFVKEPKHWRSPWKVWIKVGDTRLLLGYFADETVAARAYDAAAREHFGDFARLNFPTDQEQPACVPASTDGTAS